MNEFYSLHEIYYEGHFEGDKWVYEEIDGIDADYEVGYAKDIATAKAYANKRVADHLDIENSTLVYYKESETTITYIYRHLNVNGKLCRTGFEYTFDIRTEHFIEL